MRKLCRRAWASTPVRASTMIRAQSAAEAAATRWRVSHSSLGTSVRRSSRRALEKAPGATRLALPLNRSTSALLLWSTLPQVMSRSRPRSSEIGCVASLKRSLRIQARRSWRSPDRPWHEAQERTRREQCATGPTAVRSSTRRCPGSGSRGLETRVPLAERRVLRRCRAHRHPRHRLHTPSDRERILARDDAGAREMNRVLRGAALGGLPWCPAPIPATPRTALQCGRCRTPGRRSGRHPAGSRRPRVRDRFGALGECPQHHRREIPGWIPERSLQTGTWEDVNHAYIGSGRRDVVSPVVVRVGRVGFRRGLGARDVVLAPLLCDD